MGYTFQFDVVWGNLGFLLSGVELTLIVTVAALSSGSVVGLVVALARMSPRRWLQLPAIGYIELFRNTPALIQLMWMYYCLPLLTGLELSAVASATLALTVNGSAYIAEIIRGGIQGVDKGQVEAARTLGMSHAQTMRKIVLPQAFRRMIPPFVNESVSILKFSSLVSVLGVADLTYQAQVLSTTTFRPIEIFTFIALVYLVLCSTLAYMARRLELRLAVSD
ncbi:MAG TPA: amino acid ABC transporter permease [Burkholderiales bacterium]|nr:amino acid ABC transporter permease [Burkholderiales bacterium]